jgi:hypothetical protein
MTAAGADDWFTPATWPASLSIRIVQPQKVLWM